MSGSRFGTGKFSEDHERPILTGHSDKEAWVTELHNYVTTMRERYPDVAHPPVEWLSASISMISLDQDQSATTPLALGVHATVRDVVRDEVNKPISDMQQRLDEHTKRHTVNKLNIWQFQLTQREKDRQFCVAVFSNKAA